MSLSQKDTEDLNRAFEDHLDGYLSKDALKTITDRDGAEIASQAEAIYEEALSCPVDWSTATLDDGLRIMGELLSRKYPWLSRGARYRFTAAFIMAWK